MVALVWAKEEALCVVLVIQIEGDNTLVSALEWGDPSRT